MDVEIRPTDVFTTDGSCERMWRYRDGRCEFFSDEGARGRAASLRACHEINISHTEVRKLVESWGHTVSGDVGPSEVDELREAVRVLAAEVLDWRTQSEEECRLSSNKRYDTNDNPIAKAAVEAAKADANAGEVKGG